MTEEVRLPDGLVLMGIGGAGKEIVFATLEQEWFVKHYLESGKDLDAYIIDTATGEVAGDKKRKEQVEKEIRRIREESGGIGNVSIKVICLTGEEITVYKPSDLTREPVRNAVKRQCADIWWLEDPEKDIHFETLKEVDENIKQDFGGGTHRKRAISKAVLYKAISERSIFDFLRVVNRNVAIIVGLGGGSGSGMFFDVAERIKNQALGVTLFAILPTISERSPEKFNAYNALSELEYAKLNNLLPFDYVVLSSLQPTNYDGTTITRDVKQFDQMFAYLLASFYHARAHDGHIEDTMGKYSSFIMGSGCIVKYGVESLLQLKQKVEEWINKLEEVIKSEEELNNLINDFEWDGEGKATRDDRDEYLLPEFEGMKLWELPVFEYLDYSSITELKKDIEYAREDHPEPSGGISFEDWMQYISWVRDVALKERDYKDTVDEKIHSILPRALSVLCDAGKNIKLVYGLEMDDKAKEKLMMIVKAEPTPSEIAELKKLLEDVNEEYNNLLDELTVVRNKLENVENSPSRAQEWAEEKLAQIQENLSEISEMRRRKKEIEPKSRELSDKIENLQINARSLPIESPISQDTWLGGLNIGKVEELISKIEARGESLTGLREFVKNVVMYHYHNKMKEYYENLNTTRSKRLKNWILGEESYDNEKNNFALGAEKMKNEGVNRAEMWNIEIIDRNSFMFHIPEDFLSRGLDDKNSTKIASVNSFLEGDLDGSAITEVQGILNENGSDIEMRSGIGETLKAVYLENEKYEEKKESLNDEISKKEEEIKEKESDKKRIERIREINGKSVSIRQKIDEQKEAFKKLKVEMVSFLSEGMIKETENEGRYILNTEKPDPRVLSGVSERSSMKNVLENIPESVEKAETKKILDKVLTSMNNILLTTGYLGVAELFKVYSKVYSFEGRKVYSKDSERWNFDLGIFSVASTSDKILQAVMDKERMVKEKIAKGLSLSRQQQDASLYIYDNAGAWDTALILLAASTFVDNISSLVGGGGYREAFEELGGRMLYLHHALLLEQGKYVERKKFLGLEEAARMANDESDGDIQWLRGNYEIKDVSAELRKVTLKTEQEQNKQNDVEVRKEPDSVEE